LGEGIVIKKFEEWIYRKRMITPSALLETLAYADYLIYPDFHIMKDSSGQEMVFLCEHKQIENWVVENRTVVEALENHVHVFDNVKKRYRNDVKRISIAISRNLLRSLMQQFPDKSFVVYLDLNYKDSVIIRFHQIWADEEIYYEPKCFQSSYDNERLIMFT